MPFVDGTVVNIALPTIGRDLSAGLGTQQWVMLSYSLAVASLYIVAGALGDRYGRWLLFMFGVGGFAAASALAGVAPHSELLVLARVLQGVAGNATAVAGSRCRRHRPGLRHAHLRVDRGCSGGLCDRAVGVRAGARRACGADRQ